MPQLSAERTGYYEFLKALKKLNSDNPQCIKVDTIKVEEGNGAMKLTAAINFYGVVNVSVRSMNPFRAVVLFPRHLRNRGVSFLTS